MDTTPVEAKQPIWKQAVAIAISMLFLFLIIYIISKAWKRGQVNG